jgi:hypothetical protein
MKKMLLLGLLLSQSVCANEILIAPKVPEQAKSIEGFVPAGWKIEKKIEGDLTKDNTVDTVLELIQNPPAAAGDSQRKLLIILQNSDKSLHKAAVAEKLLLCPNCFGTMGTNADIKIEKGILIIDHLTGSRETQETTQRFRYEDKSKRFLLIGEDIINNDRLNVDGSSTKSINYLTGEQIEEVIKNKKSTKKTTKIPVKPKFIEEVEN